MQVIFWVKRAKLFAGLRRFWSLGFIAIQYVTLNA